VLELTVPGGGGFGNPRDRDRQSLEDDVRDGIVSSAAAQSLYGATVEKVR